MYFLLITLIFSLALGPDVRLLRAQDMSTELMSMLQTQQSTIFLTIRPDENFPTPTEETTNIMSKMESLTTIAEIVEPTSEEHTPSPTPELLTTPELLPTAESTFTPVPNTLQTHDLSTLAAPPESTTPKQEESTEITTTEPPSTPSPSPNIPHPTARSTKPPDVTPKTVYNEEVKTTDTSPTTTPLTTTPITRELATPTAPDSDTSPEETSPTDSSTEVISVVSSMEGSEKGTSRLIIGVIAMVIFCILATLCIMAIILKRRRQSGQQNFKHTNGQKSKKKKGTEADIWAGPVKLGGRDCEGPEEVDAQGEEKKMDGVEDVGLSTFSTLHENRDVGRPGSPEVEKWEEKEPLLFIDEEGKEKSKEAGKETDAKEVEPNGGETFCLTTAV